MGTSVNKIAVEEFVRLSEEVPVIDVRSPGEYMQGHIPGALNLPLFSDVQRAIVRTIYTHEGRAEAAVKAMELIAAEMPEKMRHAVSMAVNGKVLLYCWRGGMRSESMAWILSFCGLRPLVLEGGYKSYRNLVLKTLSEKRKMIILGGLTGSGKTKILNYLSQNGHQVTDLEGLASHKGSAFGSLGMAGQPSSEHFSNLLFSNLSGKNPDLPVWLEDESRNIGTVFMPESFYNLMHDAPVIALMMSAEVRLPRLIEEYTSFPKDNLIASVNKISKRLGGDRTREATDAIRNDDFATAIRIVLDYYDKTYRYGLSKRVEGQVVYVESDTDDVGINSSKIADAAKGLF